MNSCYRSVVLFFLHQASSRVAWIKPQTDTDTENNNTAANNSKTVTFIFISYFPFLISDLNIYLSINATFSPESAQEELFSLSGWILHIPGLQLSETMERLDGAFSIWLTTPARNSSNRDPSLKLTFRCCTATARDEGLEKGESNSMTIKNCDSVHCSPLDIFCWAKLDVYSRFQCCWL